MDTGNLVLMSNQGSRGNTSVLWESFDFPTDTSVPGMIFRLNFKSSKSTLIRSWKAADDPSIGAFSFGMEPLGEHVIQLTMWNYSQPYWRDNIWNGYTLDGILDGDNSISYLSITDEGDEIYMMVTASDPSIITRFVIEPSGTIKQFIWQKGSSRWEAVWDLGVQGCLRYSTCGPFGMCNYGKSDTFCNCSEGFSPSDLKEWSRGNWSGGCVRKTALQCAKGRGLDDGFGKLVNVKLPDRASVTNDSSEIDCRNKCLHNCSCEAYSYTKVSENFSRCLVWNGPLLDLADGLSPSKELNLRLARSDLGKQCFVSV